MSERRQCNFIEGQIKTEGDFTDVVVINTTINTVTYAIRDGDSHCYIGESSYVPPGLYRYDESCAHFFESALLVRCGLAHANTSKQLRVSKPTPQAE